MAHAELRAYTGLCNNEGLREYHFEQLPSYLDAQTRKLIISRANQIINTSISAGRMRFDGIAPCHSIEDYQKLADYLSGKIHFQERRILHQSMHGLLTFSQRIFFPGKTKKDKQRLVDLLVDSEIVPDQIPKHQQYGKEFRRAMVGLEWDSNLYFFKK